MRYNIFNTQNESTSAQAYDFAKYIAQFADDPAYVAQTLCWDIPKQRLDGKWVYRVCSASDATYLTETYSADWFPQEE